MEYKLTDDEEKMMIELAYSSLVTERLISNLLLSKKLLLEQLEIQGLTIIAIEEKASNLAATLENQGDSLVALRQEIVTLRGGIGG